MRLTTFLLTLCLCFGLVQAEESTIITRDGNKYKYEITQYGVDFIKYKLRKREMNLNYTDIYMIYNKNQNARFVNQEGILEPGDYLWEEGNCEKIYLVNGGVLSGKVAAIRTDGITFTFTKVGRKILKKFGKNLMKVPRGNWPKNSYLVKYAYEADIPHTLKREEVFMIEYKGGVTEIITPLPSVGSKANIGNDDLDLTSVASEELTPQNQDQGETQLFNQAFIAENDDESEENSEPLQQLKFHQVTKGETLASIAERYGVTTQEIIEWNDLPTNLKPKAILPEDTQLAIYVLVIQ